jgi:hypothetical protein
MVAELVNDNDLQRVSTPMTEQCREFGTSRKVACKIFNHYVEHLPDIANDSRACSSR